MSVSEWKYHLRRDAESDTRIIKSDEVVCGESRGYYQYSYSTKLWWGKEEGRGNWDTEWHLVNNSDCIVGKKLGPVWTGVKWREIAFPRRVVNPRQSKIIGVVTNFAPLDCPYFAHQISLPGISQPPTSSLPPHPSHDTAVIGQSSESSSWSSSLTQHVWHTVTVAFAKHSHIFNVVCPTKKPHWDKHP